MYIYIYIYIAFMFYEFGQSDTVVTYRVIVIKLRRLGFK